MALMQIFSVEGVYRVGVMRTYLNSDYSFSESKDTVYLYNRMKGRVVSVYYVDENQVYGLTVNTFGNNMLIHFNLSGDVTNAIQAWNLKSLASKADGYWFGHLDSVITGLNTDPKNLPVNGFMSASLNIIKSYNEFCEGGDLYSINDYKSIWWLNDKSKFVGVFDRIEIHSKSCGKNTIVV